MLPDSAFPGVLPLTPDAVRALLHRLDEFDAAVGAFLTFVMVPVEPRIGEWRYAGATGTLAEAIRQAGRFVAGGRGGSPDGPALLRSLLDIQGEDWAGFPMQAPPGILGPHRTVLRVAAGAPYDDRGLHVVEVPGPAGADTLAGWRAATLAWVREAGTRRFGPPPAAVWGGVERDSGPEDWTRWGEHWDEFGGWADVAAL